jgi:hypothetical protein
MAQARFIRVDDDTWKKAQQRAAQENTTVSELARTWIEWYAEGYADGYEPESVNEELRSIANRLNKIRTRIVTA